MLRILIATVVLLAAQPAAAATATLAPGEPLTHAVVERLVDQAARAAGVPGPLELRIEAPRLPLGNPGREPIAIALEGLDLDPDRGRFTAVLVGRIAGEVRFHLPAEGRARELVEIPVLVRAVARGELVGEDDITWVTITPDRIRRGVLVDAAAVVGAEARRRLSAGRPLRARDLGRPRLVERGSTVRLIFDRPGLRLSAEGVARDDGAAGELVRVTNPASGRVIQGVVSAPGEITVRPSGG